jgi:hypothetical protein
MTASQSGQVKVRGLSDADMDYINQHKALPPHLAEWFAPSEINSSQGDGEQEVPILAHP